MTIYRCRVCGASAPMQEIRDPDRPGLIGIVPECPAGHGRDRMDRDAASVLLPALVEWHGGPVAPPEVRAEVERLRAILRREADALRAHPSGQTTVVIPPNPGSTQGKGL